MANFSHNTPFGQSFLTVRSMDTIGLFIKSPFKDTHNEKANRDGINNRVYPRRGMSFNSSIVLFFCHMCSIIFTLGNFCLKCYLLYV
ncbi:uncharacterized protein B0P05DRAFT_534670 [Gilbertella persicaria]|uniref:uncharacterized protein n=1 Tax=Gilbertella persicaria TaxID=101096 RepID=UPI002220184D|nr:uncharacterized protein B0P05DRAFT_534670 [Gilbertella persicaria]KAI8084227.1 hypothetical protein B0P05DRAFT_534670 [Gilbertella persicaria]